MKEINYQLVLNDLEKMNEEEILLKKRWELQNKSEAQSALLFPDHTKEPPQKNFYPESSPLMEENDFLAPQRNIKLIKHDRYSPFFLHEHSFFEIVYVLSGSCIQNFPEKKLALRTGDLHLISPHVEHSLEVFDESVILNILIRRSTFLNIFNNVIRDKSLISAFFLSNLYSKKQVKYLLFHTDGNLEIRNYILDMYLEQLLDDEYSDHIMNSILEIFFVQLTRTFKKTAEHSQPSRKALKYEEAMINYIITNYSSASLKSVADEFHLSVSYCSKRIRDLTGYSFSELLRSIRLQKGKDMLNFTQMSVAAVSQQLGYENPESFIRVFKKQYGTTPSQYRKNSQDVPGAESGE